MKSFEAEIRNEEKCDTEKTKESEKKMKTEKTEKVSSYELKK